VSEHWALSTEWWVGVGPAHLYVERDDDCGWVCYEMEGANSPPRNHGDVSRMRARRTSAASYPGRKAGPADETFDKVWSFPVDGVASIE